MGLILIINKSSRVSAAYYKPEHAVVELHNSVKRASALRLPICEMYWEKYVVRSRASNPSILPFTLSRREHRGQMLFREKLKVKNKLN
jgi:hypothetical protein